MRKVISAAAAYCCAALVTTSPASAQEVCEALLAYGTFDSTDTFSDKEDFRLVQHLLCRSTITTHQQAVDVQAELNVPILEVLAIDFGGSVSTATFSTAQEAFCQKDFSTASSRESLLVQVKGEPRVGKRVRRLRDQDPRLLRLCDAVEGQEGVRDHAAVQG